MTRRAWFTCFSGISGDMALGALLDAGADVDEVRALVDRASGSPGSSLVPVGEGRAQWLHACWSTRVLGGLQDAFVGGERAPHRALEGLSLLEVGGLEASSLADADWPSDVSRSEPGASRHGR